MLHRRHLLQATGAWLLWPHAYAQAQTGDVRDELWLDTSRQRTLPWRLRLPATPGPWPWVLYSHGLGGSREGGALWGQAWAAAGIAVLHLQHPGSDSQTLQQGLRALRAAASGTQLLARVADMRFAMDEVARRAAAGEAPWSALRADAIGMAGHSFGAVTTQALAGQAFPGGAVLGEPRPRAFVALSPSSPAGGRSMAQAFAGVARPFLCITGSADGDPLGSSTTGAPRAAVYDGLPPGQRALLWLDGADHGTFGGGRPPGLPTRTLQRRPASATEHEAAHQALVATITTHWWRWRLLSDTAARGALSPPAGLGPQDRFSLG